jgi:ABC-type sugar transport system permease subunit
MEEYAMKKYIEKFSTMIEKKPNILGWLFVLPSFLIIASVVIYPIIRTMWLSLTSYSLVYPLKSQFIGLTNYFNFFTSQTFWATIGRTAYFTFISTGIELVLGISIAYLINLHLKGWKFLRTLVILPWAVPTVVNAIMWKWIYNAEYGAFNGLLKTFNLIEKYQTWLSEPWTAMNLVILADVWKCTPFVILIVSATLATIDEDLYEAADIDGASALQRFSYITLPLLKPAIMISLVIRTVEAFKAFDIIYVLTRGGPANGTQIISYQAYLESFSYLNMGRGSALSFIVSIFILSLALIYIRILYTEEVV